MKKTLASFLMVILCVLFFSCNPKSYCFFSPIKGLISVEDTSKIKGISVFSSISNNRGIRGILFDTTLYSPSKQFTISLDSIKGKYIEISVRTTDYRDSYFLRIYPKDWQREKKLKFRQQIR